MIHAKDFVDAASAHGFDFYAGVPCSYLKPFINYVINEPNLCYLSAANEGDAVATAAGAVLGGRRAVAMMQNSGLGNAVSPLTSLTYTFRIPILVVCTHRGAPGTWDEPQHALMGRITGQLFDTMSVPRSPFPDTAAGIPGALERVEEAHRNEGLPYALIMQKGTCQPHPLAVQPPHQSKAAIEILGAGHTRSAAERPTRQAVLSELLAATDPADSAVVATTGYTGRELYALDDRPNHFYMVGSMGCASSLGLGLALARPELRVIVVDGDGAALMRMGNLATIGAYHPRNLVHLLLDNEAHDSTGGQHTVSPGTDFAKIAVATGYGQAWATDDLTDMNAILNERGVAGPVFAHLKTRTGTIENLPRPSIPPVEIRARFMSHIETAGRR